MKEFFKGKVFKIIVAVLAVLVGVMIYQATTGGYASLPEAVIGTLVTPVVRVSSGISNSVAGFFNMIINAKDIEKENKELHKELSAAYDKLSDFEKYKNENVQLKEMLGIKEKNPDYEMVSASVVGRDSASAFGKFTVNKGSFNGVKLNNPVITEDGLVGIVSHVGTTFSTVTTILDPEINVGIYNSRTQETGVISGSADLSVDGKTKLRPLPRDTALLKGDIIETSGIGGMFPSGVMIGTVNVIKAENSGVSMYAEIKPLVSVKDVSSVVIITDFTEGQVEIPKEEESEESEKGDEEKVESETAESEAEETSSTNKTE